MIYKVLLILASIAFSGCNHMYHPDFRYTSPGAAFMNGYNQAKERRLKREQQQMYRDIQNIKRNMGIYY